MNNISYLNFYESHLIKQESCLFIYKKKLPITEFLKKIYHYAKIHSNKSSYWNHYLALHPHTPKEILLELYNANVSDVLASLYKNESLPEEVFEDIKNKNSIRELTLVIHNSNCPEFIFRHVYDLIMINYQKGPGYNSNLDIMLMDLCHTPNTPTDILWNMENLKNTSYWKKNIQQHKNYKRVASSLLDQIKKSNH